MYHDIKLVANEIQDLLLNYQQAAMGTYEGIFPMVTKVTPIYIPEEDSIYMLLSDLSEHTMNLRAFSGMCSLYFAAEEKHATAMNNPRLTVCGLATLVDKQSHLYLMEHFEKRDKGCKLYSQFADFNIWKMYVASKTYVSGFGKAYKKLEK